MKRNLGESGIALITALLLTFIFTLMALGFFYVVTGEQKMAAIERDHGSAYYGAQAGLEKMSADLAATFTSNASPTLAQVQANTGTAPVVPGITFPTAGWVVTGYPNPATLTSSTQTIGGSGPLVGLQGIVTPFLLSVTADSASQAEVKLTRIVQEVAVPVFQFGIFSDNDLSFFAGPNFNFGGRVHTNKNLFVAEGNGNTLTLADKVTALQDVIRTQLSNGWPTTSGYNGTVSMMTNPPNPPNGAPLTQSQGSRSAPAPGGTPNGSWSSISNGTFNGNIKTGATGATRLNLVFALGGINSPIEMIRRPPVGESVTSTLGAARFFNEASVRILLSDDPPSAITGLPGVTNTPPYPLDETGVQRTAPAGSFYLPPLSACTPPLAQSPGYLGDSDYMSPVGTPLLSGRSTRSYLKIEIQLQATPGTWQDVTQEVLGLG